MNTNTKIKLKLVGWLQRGGGAKGEGSEARESVGGDPNPRAEIKHNCRRANDKAYCQCRSEKQSTSLLSTIDANS